MQKMANFVSVKGEDLLSCKLRQRMFSNFIAFGRQFLQSCGIGEQCVAGHGNMLAHIYELFGAASGAYPFAMEDLAKEGPTVPIFALDRLAGRRPVLKRWVKKQ